jgi:hypothetical protein
VSAFRGKAGIAKRPLMTQKRTRAAQLVISAKEQKWIKVSVGVGPCRSTTTRDIHDRKSHSNQRNKGCYKSCKKADRLESTRNQGPD